MTANQTSAASPSEDLSAEITRTVEKRPGDHVKCTRISGNDYRCNWWSPESLIGYDNPSMQGLLVTTHRVRKSQFLRVTRSEGGLSIEDLSARSEG